MDQVPIHFVPVIFVCLEFTGSQHTFSKYFSNSSVLWTCSGVKFQDSGGAHLVLVHSIPHILPPLAIHSLGRSLGGVLKEVFNLKRYMQHNQEA